MLIAQCKGKELSKVPASRLLTTGWIGSIKYDGNYVQIHKVGNTISFYTSGDKQFYHELVAEQLLKNTADFIIEAEFIAESEGKLGDRTSAAKLTTYRTNYSKGLANVGINSAGDTFRVFDIISYNNTMLTCGFAERINHLQKLKLANQTKIVEFSEVMDLITAKAIARSLVDNGFEGLYIKRFDHKYLPGKRVNDAIKLKYRPTADLLCIDVEEGVGKYTGMIGSLVLQDSKGRLVKVGSGLSDELRSLDSDYFIDSIIEIEYEQILDTYIQPTFVGIRFDKKDID